MSCNNFNFGKCFAVLVGDDYTMSFRDTGEGADFTGFDFVMTIKDKTTGATLLTLPIVGDTQTTGIYIDVPTDAEMFIQVRKEDSLVVGEGNHVYDIRQTDPSGNESTFEYGTIPFIVIN